MRWMNLQPVIQSGVSLDTHLVCCDPHSQRFGVVNNAEVDVFLELSCFFCDPTDVSNLIIMKRQNLVAEGKYIYTSFCL